MLPKNVKKMSQFFCDTKKVVGGMDWLHYSPGVESSFFPFQVIIFLFMLILGYELKEKYLLIALI